MDNKLKHMGVSQRVVNRSTNDYFMRKYWLAGLVEMLRILSAATDEKTVEHTK